MRFGEEKNVLPLHNWLGYAVAQLVEALRCSWKVTGSIPDGLNPSGRTMSLGSTQSLTDKG